MYVRMLRYELIGTGTYGPAFREERRVDQMNELAQ